MLAIGTLTALLIMTFLVLNMAKIRVMDWFDVPMWQGEPEKGRRLRVPRSTSSIGFGDFGWLMIPFTLFMFSDLMLLLVTIHVTRFHDNDYYPAPKEFYKLFLSYIIISMWMVYHAGYIIIIWTTDRNVFVFSMLAFGTLTALLIMAFLVLNMPKIGVMDWFDVPMFQGELEKGRRLRVPRSTSIEAKDLGWLTIPLTLCMLSDVMFLWASIQVTKFHDNDYWPEGTVGSIICPRWR
ncbi:uncharacterized protein [Drosophila takahashii]